MKLVTVQCARPQDAEDDEPRLAITIADGAEEAEQLCRREYASDGYTRFNAKDTIDGHLPGPAHILGYTGKTPAFQLETINQLGRQRRPQLQLTGTYRLARPSREDVLLLDDRRRPN